MQIHIANGWVLFCISFGLMLATTFIMSRLSRHFYTLDVGVRRFSIMDIEWPASPIEFRNLVAGMFQLPEPKRAKAISSFKKHLMIDFLFMPAVYGSIFLLCMKISLKMSTFGTGFFAFLAWAQIVAFLLDIIENIFLFKKLKPDLQAFSKSTYKAMQLLEIIKWGLPLFSVICAFSAVLYFWLNGLYDKQSLTYAVVIFVEIALFMVISRFAGGTSKKKKNSQ